jgi:hypothetical protein
MRSTRNLEARNNVDLCLEQCLDLLETGSTAMCPRLITIICDHFG